MKQAHHAEQKKLNNRGSALIMVLTVISFIAILGALSLSTALLNVRMRGLNRSQDKNFYELETALDEIYAQTGRISSEILKEQYALVVGKLYTEYKDNDAANKALKKGFIDGFKDQILGGTATAEDLIDPGNSADIAKRLKEMSATFSDPEKADGFDVSIASVILNKETITFKDLCLTYTNPETEAQSALTVDFTVNVPWIRFINNGDAMLDYVMVANEGISIKKDGTLTQKNELNGSIYGGFITINNADVTVNTRMMTSGGTLSVEQTGKLSVGTEKAEDTDLADGSVWAADVKLSAGSTLDSNHMNFYVKDDLTLTGNTNTVKLNGGYYGYGNEGTSEEKTKTPAMSSAIIINDRGSRVDLSGLHSLMLAGRSYINFDSNNPQYAYPMGESLAVRAAQTMYLIPASGITVDGKPAGSNPVLLEQRKDPYEITITIKAGERGEKDAGTVQDYRVSILYEAEKPEVSSDSDSSSATFMYLKGKLYAFYDFETDRERSEYFEHNLQTKAANFDSLLKNADMTGNQEESGGVVFNKDGQITTSGSLYQVAGNETEHLFELLDKRRSGGTGDSIKWVELGRKLGRSYENIKDNLAESVRVTGERDKEKNNYPMGNYVKLGELGKNVVYKEQEENGGAVFLSGPDVIIDTDKGLVESGTTDKSMTSGLVVSAGDVTIYGGGEFKGLIMAKGRINIAGGATLTADPDTYFPLLEEKDISKYFYDYSEAASTVINHYEDFVLRENWRRTGLEAEGETK